MISIDSRCESAGAVWMMPPSMVRLVLRVSGTEARFGREKIVYPVWVRLVHEQREQVIQKQLAVWGLGTTRMPDRAGAPHH